MYVKAKEIKVLDSLRGIYCLFVLFLHCNLPNTRFIESQDLTDFIFLMGSMGVDGFFCLSGFIITHCYQTKFLDAFEMNSKNLFRTFLKFFVNRIGRLYPLVLFSETMTILLKWDTTNCLYEYFLICGWFDKWNGNTPLWSLGAEFTLYILFPLFLWMNTKINPLNKLKINIALSLVIPICFNLTRFFYDYPNNFFIIFSVGPLFRGIQGFYCGICFYKIYEYYPQNHYIFDFIGLGVIISMIAIILYCNQVYSYIYILFSLTLFLSKTNCFLKYIFEIELLKIVGEISFTIYLLHYPIIKYLDAVLDPYMDKLNKDYHLRFFIALGLYGFIFTFSLIVYRYYETPLRNFIRNKWELIDIKIYEKKIDDENQKKDDKIAKTNLLKT